MKHVYPPRHPAWLDDKGGQVPPAGADAPQAVPTGGQDEAGKGGPVNSGPSADDDRTRTVGRGAEPARRP